MSHSRLLLGVWTDHETGGVAQRYHGQPMRLTQLHEARRLVTGHRIDSATQMHGVIGNQAEGFAFDTDQRGN